MRGLRLLCNFATKKQSINRSLTILTSRSFHHFVKCKSNLSSTVLATNKVNGLSVHTETDENEELLEEFPEVEAEQLEPFENARDILFKNSSDEIINELNKCVSVEEVLNLVKKNIDCFEDKHITHTIFILKDLQNMCYHYSSGITIKEFVENLYTSQDFRHIVNYIEDKLSSFNPEYLSYVLLYLNKLGISVEEPVLQKISMKIRDHLLKNFSLEICSRLLKVIFTESSVRPYYISLNLIPKITSHIGNCESIKDLGNLTVCLKNIHNIVTSKLLHEYKENVTDFLKCKKLKGEDYSVLLKVISFLNYPKWKNENIVLISECILLMQNEINVLNVNEIISLYEVVFRNKEPAEVLNNIQRCTGKHLQRFEMEPLEFHTRLKLFSSLIFFSSPTHRIQFRKDIPKYLKYLDNLNTFVLLKKIFSYIKVSDEKLCAKYWDMSLKLLSNTNTRSVVVLCHNYMNFTTDIDDYRHYQFEHRIMKTIEESVKNGTVFFPAIISTYLSFAMVYGKSELVLNYLIEKFEQNLSQFKAGDCVKLSHSILLLTDIKDSCIRANQIDRIKKSLHECSQNLFTKEEDNYIQNYLLVKGAILRNDYDNYLVECLLTKYKEMEHMSSNFIENISYMLMATDSLIPEVINKCTEYIIKNPKNILAFNAERILNMCFYMAYYPINAEKFFEVVTDIIIRDQERLSGLAFLQSALSLCYFHMLPSSFIKQIFNVEFLEKLDVELANCYSKDKYPQRVRNRLMQLNRAVCLEYPEYNVPWFHKKYIDEIQKRFVKDVESHFPLRIKEYLIEVVGKPDYILENVITPYGYHLDFVINLDNKEKVVAPDSTNIKKRVALLLMRHYGFTRFYTHLKGKYQLKKRHLEILGYSVTVIKFDEWINLLYAQERLDYLSNMIWPSDLNHSVNICKR